MSHYLRTNGYNLAEAWSMAEWHYHKLRTLEDLTESEKAYLIEMGKQWLARAQRLEKESCLMTSLN